MHPAPGRPAAAHVGGKVLAHPEDQAPAAHQGEDGESERVRIGAEQPHAVGVVQRAPEAPQRAGQAARDLQRSRQARVVRQGDKTDASG